jgi:hypothetical protein
MSEEISKRFIHERIHSPSHYKRFRIKVISPKKGIEAVIGVKVTKGRHGGTTEIQSVLVPKRLGLKEARKIKRELVRV